MLIGKCFDNETAVKQKHLVNTPDAVFGFVFANKHHGRVVVTDLEDVCLVELQDGQLVWPKLDEEQLAELYATYDPQQLEKVS